MIGIFFNIFYLIYKKIFEVYIVEEIYHLIITHPTFLRIVEISFFHVLNSNHKKYRSDFNSILPK